MLADVPMVSLGRLLAAVGVALMVAALAVLVALLAPFRFEGTAEPSRVGAVPAASVDDRITEDLARASQFYGQLSRLDPDPRHRQTAAEAEFQLGEYFEKINPALALQHFQASADFLEDYRHGWPWFKVGSLLAAVGQDGEADDRFARTMQIDDGRLALLAGYERGKIALRRGQTDRAWDFFYRFLRFYPLVIENFRFLNMLGNGAEPSGRGLYVVGRSLLALGRVEEARPLLLKFAEEFPRDISGRFYATRVGADIPLPKTVQGDLLAFDPHLSAGVRKTVGGVAFFSSARLMFDVYAQEDEAPMRLLITSDGKGDEPFTITILANAQTVFERSPNIPLQRKRLCNAGFSLREGHNIVEVAVQHFAVTSDRSTPFLRITSVALHADGALI